MGREAWTNPKQEVVWCEYMKEKYPSLYSHGLSQEFNNGWRKIIEDLSDKLEPLCASVEDADRGKPYCEQVKQKFGGLRFYMSHISKAGNEIDFRISEAEIEASRTCELCGKPGVKRKRVWVQVLCDECDKCRK